MESQLHTIKQSKSCNSSLDFPVFTISLFKMRTSHRQQSFEIKTWGGRRAGSGRKRHTDEAPHRERPELDANYPLHVTVRLRKGTNGLRRKQSHKELGCVFARAQENVNVRLCHFAVIGDVIHFIVEADDKVALRRGITGINVRIARALNRVTKNNGRVITDRYQARSLKTATELRKALDLLQGKAQKPTLTSMDVETVTPPKTSLLRRAGRR